LAKHSPGNLKQKKHMYTDYWHLVQCVRTFPWVGGVA